MDSIISLNVGGVIYTTAYSNLTKYPDSMLGKMFTGDLQSALDSDGNVFIDRDGKLFRYILVFLRSSQLLLPENFQELDLLAAEAEFFRILPLIQALREKASPPQSSTNVEEIVSFNVSGTIYTVLKKRLQSPHLGKYEKCADLAKKLLGKVCDPNTLKDKDGHNILEGDPVLFRYLLNFIQTGYFWLPSDFTEYFQLQIELYRYNINMWDVLPQYLQGLLPTTGAFRQTSGVLRDLLNDERAHGKWE